MLNLPTSCRQIDRRRSLSHRPRPARYESVLNSLDMRFTCSCRQTENGVLLILQQCWRIDQPTTSAANSTRHLVSCPRWQSWEARVDVAA